MFECFKSVGVGLTPNNIIISKFDGKAKSKSVVMKEFLAEIIKISARTMESNFSFDQLNQLYNVLYSSGASAISFNDLLDSMNHHGQLLKKPGNIYKLCIT